LFVCLYHLLPTYNQIFYFFFKLIFISNICLSIHFYKSANEPIRIVFKLHFALALFISSSQLLVQMYLIHTLDPIFLSFFFMLILISLLYLTIIWVIFYFTILVQVFLTGAKYWQLLILWLVPNLLCFSIRVCINYLYLFLIKIFLYGDNIIWGQFFCPNQPICSSQLECTDFFFIL